MLNNKLSAGIGFLIGTAAGIGIGIQLVKSKYAKQAQEDHEELRAYYEEKRKTDQEEFVSGLKSVVEETESKAEVVPDTKQNNYKALTRELQYQPEPGDNPYVISPDEFGEFDDYNQISLTYYSDGILTDDSKEIIDPSEFIGDGLNHFGEYEDDAVFVRNDAKRCDYEVLMVEETYN